MFLKKIRFLIDRILNQSIELACKDANCLGEIIRILLNYYLVSYSWLSFRTSMQSRQKILSRMKSVMLYPILYLFVVLTGQGYLVKNARNQYAANEASQKTVPSSTFSILHEEDCN